MQRIVTVHTLTLPRDVSVQYARKSRVIRHYIAKCVAGYEVNSTKNWLLFTPNRSSRLSPRNMHRNLVTYSAASLGVALIGVASLGVTLIGVASLGVASLGVASLGITLIGVNRHKTYISQMPFYQAFHCNTKD